MTMQEYNKDFYPKLTKAQSFVSTIDNALAKCDDNAQMQLKVIGWDDETKQLLMKALACYCENTKSLISPASNT